MNFETHFGQGHYWPQMHDDAEEYVCTCLVIQPDKLKQEASWVAQAIATPQRPWGSVLLDFIANLPKERVRPPQF